MPKNDYADPELRYPRLQAHIWTLDGTTQLLDVWLWKEAGKSRIEITRGQRAGSIDEAHALIMEFEVKYQAVCDADDIDVDD